MNFDFEKAIRKFISGMMDERRWRIYAHMNITYENVLMHLFKQTMQTMFMLEIERKDGNPWGLDLYRLLVSAPTHDMPEGHEDYEDLNYYIKRKNPELRIKYKEKEKRLFHQMMAEMFGKDTGSLIPVSLDMDNEAPKVNRVYWEALEHISHLMFILEELMLGGLTSEEQVGNFERDVVHEHGAFLLEHAFHFSSVRFMVVEQILPKWELYKKREELKKG